ncbi:MAG: hypothetical protein AB1510_05240 [Bacillota bacterium]
MTHETMPNLLYALLLQDFPESLVIVLFIFSLLNLRLRDRRVLILAVLQTLSNLMRLLPVANGMHSVVITILLAMYMRIFTGIRLSRIFFAILVCGLVSISLSLAYSGPLLKLTGLSYETAFANPFLRSAFALPYEVVLGLAALWKNHYNCKKGLLSAIQKIE